MTPDSIFIFDLHNTLYDEVVEFGSGFAAALNLVKEAADAEGVECTTDSLASELAMLHAAAGSDWDPNVWQDLPTILKLSNSEEVAKAALAQRLKKSEMQTRLTAYTDTIEALHSIKDTGASLYLATEATANAAADAVRWLSLDGLFESVYSWPYKKPYQKLEKSRQLDFPALLEDSGGVQKPHPFIIAQIVLDHGKARNLLPDSLTLEAAFRLERNAGVDVTSLQQLAGADSENVAFQQAVLAVQSRLRLLETSEKEVLQKLLDSVVYVGDSFFKDGILAYNAGVSFVHAAYGKTVALEDAPFVEECKQTLYAVTGWEPLLLQCTHEASKIPELSAKVNPAFVCKSSFAEYLEYRKGKND